MTVNVQAGTSYTEQVTFNQITGATSVNSITINGNNTTLSNGTAGTFFTIRLNGTDFMNMNNLNVIAFHASQAFALSWGNQANSNTFTSCTFSVNNTATGSGVIPVVGSQSGTSYSSSGDIGNNNVWNNCNMIGGYFSISFYGNTVAPFTTGNHVYNCTLTDFYNYSLYNYYNRESTFAGNLFERPFRTNSTTVSAVLLNTGSLKCIVEKNRIRNLFSAMLTNASTCYAIYPAVSPGLGNENIIRNNIISDIRSGGPLIGIYNSGYTNYIIYNNTISFDDILSTSGSACYGIQCTAGTNTVVNNIITIGRGGAGPKYNFYYGTTNPLTGLVSDFNVAVMTATAGTRGIGYAASLTYASMSNWKTAMNASWDQNSTDADPQYVQLGLNYEPTNILVNNLGTYTGLTDDINGSNRSIPTPDPGAIEIFNVPCSGQPPVGTVITPTMQYCGKTPINITMPAYTFSNSGYSYQWMSSTVTPLGPFTVIPGATLTALTTSSLVNVTTYYTMRVICPNNGTVNATSGAVLMVLTTTNTVPYKESFETLNAQNKLPNCSWAVTNSLVAMSQTIANTLGRLPYEGNQFAMFQNSPAGTNYFYTNGIWMDPGITYSASLRYVTESTGANNWTELAILVGPNQTPTGLMPVVSVTPAVAPMQHKLLFGYFSVPASGLYYVAIKANGAAGAATYLSFDNVEVGIPCALNSPTMALSLLSSTVCSDKPLDLAVTGADTYTWSTGENSAAITVTPTSTSPNFYSVSGTKAISGCSVSLTQFLTVYPSPVIIASSNVDEVCLGSSAILSASGGQNVYQYSWSNGHNSQNNNIVTPTSNTTYSVIGINNYGCSGMDMKTITVRQLPNISMGNNPTNICEGDAVVLTANGGQSYNWMASNAITYAGNPILIQPMGSLIFTVTGTDAHGCSNKVVYTLIADICAGIKNINKQDLVKVYPNPSNGIFTIESGSAAEKMIEVTDMTGRIVKSGSVTGTNIQVNLNDVADGIYYLKVKSGDAVDVIKVVKSH